MGGLGAMLGDGAIVALEVSVAVIASEGSSDCESIQLTSAKPIKKFNDRCMFFFLLMKWKIRFELLKQDDVADPVLSALGNPLLTNVAKRYCDGSAG
jgi:hypothetical protein